MIGISVMLKAKICKAVEPIYLKEIEHKTFELNEVMVLKMWQHLHEWVRYLDNFDKTELKKECDIYLDHGNN